MRFVRALLRHELAGATIRYGICGVIVGLVYIGTPLFLNGVLGVPIQVAIPLAYLTAISLHFNLQRHFVFRHVEYFALSVRQQIGRYAAIGAVQYPTTAIATAELPGLLGISGRLAFVIITLSISTTAFLLLRGHVFHPTGEERLSEEAEAERPEHLERRIGGYTPGEPDRVGL